jgi:hypothetical protein
MDHSRKPKPFPAAKPAKNEHAYEKNGHLRGPPAESTAPTETRNGAKETAMTPIVSSVSMVLRPP